MSVALSLSRSLAAAGLTWALLSAHRWSSRAAEADHARAHLEATLSKTQEIARLRQIQPTALLNARPVESVSGPLRAALRVAGVGDESLRSVSGSADESAAGAGAQPMYRRLAVAVQVSPITTRQLGVFLAEWARSEPAWVVTRVDLSHLGPDTEPESTYDLRMTIATTYLSPSTRTP